MAGEREPYEWYVEESACVHQLIEAERFEGTVWDPACGSATIPRVFREYGIRAIGTDLIERGYEDRAGVDFLACDHAESDADVIVSNFPYADSLMPMIEHARRLVPKVCALVPMRFLNSSARASFFRLTPPARVWVLSNRPSMPPGSKLQDGSVKVGGGKIDYCWLVFERGHNGPPEMGWLVWPRAKVAAHRADDRDLWKRRRGA